MMPSRHSGSVTAPPPPVERMPALKLSRRKIGLDEANEMLKEIVEHIETSPSDVSVDLSGVEEATSACVAVLVRAGQIARKAGKRLTVLATSPVIRCLLQLNRLERLLSIRETDRPHNPKQCKTSPQAVA